jgi:hypothetical protein
MAVLSESPTDGEFLIELKQSEAQKSFQRADYFRFGLAVVAIKDPHEFAQNGNRNKDVLAIAAAIIQESPSGFGLVGVVIHYVPDQNIGIHRSHVPDHPLAIASFMSSIETGCFALDLSMPRSDSKS